MNSLTGDFDLVIELTGAAIQRLIEGMHAVGVIRHVFVRGFQTKNVELIINCPQIGLYPAAPPDNITRATATSRVLYHSRNINDAKDPGLSVIADVTVRAKLFLTGGDPAPLNANTYLAVDWSETTAADITVYSSDPNVVNEVQGALLDFIASEGGGSYLVPPIGIGANQPIGSLAFQFIGGSNEWLAVGMNVGGVIKGAKSQLQTSFIQEDWGLACSSDYVVNSILDALRSQLGALPPPYGMDHVLLSDATICVLPNPFGGCIASADQKVYLESLGIALEYGQIAITGSLKQVTDSILIPPVTANFQASATLSIGANQSLQVTVSQPAVQLNEWYAQLLNTLAGGAFTTAIANGIQAALQSSGGSSLSDVISANTLQSITSLGGQASINLDVTVDSVSIVPEAIITQGSLHVYGRNAPPVAEAVALRGPSALALNLNALGSWSPAHHATSFLWDFGDGSPPLSSTDIVPAVAVNHTWPAPGLYTVTLTVSNEAGAATSTQLQVKPGVLEILAPEPANLMGPWSVCAQPGDYTVTFTVLASGYPAPDAVVVVRVSTTPERTLTANTNQLGQASFTVNNSMFTSPPPTGSFLNLIGGMLVNAFCADYIWAWNYLWLWDCITILGWPQLLMEKFTEAVLSLSSAVNAPVSAAPSLLQDLALSQSLLANLAQLVARGSQVFPLEMLLGLQGATEQREHLESIAEQAIKNVQSLSAVVQNEALARRDPDRQVQLLDAPGVAALVGSGRQQAYQQLAAMVRGQDGMRETEQPGTSKFSVAPKTATA